MAAVDWDLPDNGEDYSDVLTQVRNRDENIAKMDFASDTNIPDEVVRYNTGTDKFQRYDSSGPSWSNLAFHTTIDNHIADSDKHYEIPAGTIWMYGGGSAPSGTLLCDGTAVSRTTYADLFTAIGTTYGSGDGSTTFNLPDLRQRFPLGKAASGTGSTLGGTGGNIDHTHSTPNHTHTVGTHRHTMSHTHQVGAHSHPIASHEHTVPAHYHSTTGSGADIAISGAGGAHTHGIPTRNNVNSFDNGGDAVGKVNLAWAGAYHIDTENAGGHTHAHGDFAGRVGNVSSGNNGDSGFSTTSGTLSATSNSTAFTSGGSSAANTGYSGDITTDAGEGGGTSGTANPPFQVVNFIIKT